MCLANRVPHLHQHTTPQGDSNSSLGSEPSWEETEMERKGKEYQKQLSKLYFNQVKTFLPPLRGHTFPNHRDKDSLIFHSLACLTRPSCLIQTHCGLASHTPTLY